MSILVFYAHSSLTSLSSLSLNRVWPRQKTNSRIIFVKRAQVYHSGRLYMNALYRRRSALDDRLLRSLIDFSISTYTRVRRSVSSHKPKVQNLTGRSDKHKQFCKASSGCVGSFCWPLAPLTSLVVLRPIHTLRASSHVRRFGKRVRPGPHERCTLCFIRQRHRYAL